MPRPQDVAIACCCSSQPPRSSGGALRGAALLEAVALRSRGAAVKIVIPDASARPLMGRLMDPDRGGRVLAAGYQQGLALGR